VLLLPLHATSASFNSPWISRPLLLRAPNRALLLLLPRLLLLLLGLVLHPTHRHVTTRVTRNDQQLVQLPRHPVVLLLLLQSSSEKCLLAQPSVTSLLLLLLLVIAAACSWLQFGICNAPFCITRCCCCCCC
jgi:hypothetical protein